MQPGRAALTATTIAMLLSAPPTGAAPYWGTTGRNSQHTAIGDVATQPLERIHWKTPVDRRRQYTRRGSLLAHYGSPMITAGNTVIVPVKAAAEGKFRVVAFRGDGRRVWTRRSDYIVPPHDWMPTFSPVLSSTDKLWMPARGGTVITRDLLDGAGGDAERLAYYGVQNYKSGRRTFRDSVFINTPLTADGHGNVFFGVRVEGTPPADLESVLVRMTDAGEATMVTPFAMTGDSAMTRVLSNSAPALSNDGTRLYVAVTDGTAGYLVALDAATLATIASVRLVDPSSAMDSLLHEAGTAAPMVGPDGHVYFGVLEQLFGWNHGRGWLMHFDADLQPAGYVGAFGWDDTPSMVPASIVPSYTGSSPYLLMSKYNDYAQAGGTGEHRVAILDPNEAMRDPITGLDVMAEVLTALSPTPDEELTPIFPKALREWCINTAAIDPVTKSVLANNEDGHLYRWDLTSGELTESIMLNGGLGQAYTPTLSGPDGIVYAINDGMLFAIGSLKK